MSLQQFITERLKITSKTKHLKRTEHTLFPKDKEELLSMIRNELKQQGNDADMNHIDTSKITDMSYLLNYRDIRNIKIDEWDTSNVTTMEEMFTGSDDFDCDLSTWDVSNVTNMSLMFYKCKSFKSDLSKWNVSKVEDWEEIFTGSLMESNPQLQPKFS